MKAKIKSLFPIATLAAAILIPGCLVSCTSNKGPDFVDRFNEQMLRDMGGYPASYLEGDKGGYGYGAPAPYRPTTAERFLGLD